MQSGKGTRPERPAEQGQDTAAHLQAMSTCARNLPQHFNTCTCTQQDGGVTAEAADIDLAPSYAGGMDTTATDQAHSFGDSISEIESRFDVKIESLTDDEGQDYLRVSYGQDGTESLNLDSDGLNRVVDSATSHSAPPSPGDYDFALYEWMEDARWR